MTLLHEKRVAEPDLQGASAGLVRYEDDAYGWALQQGALLRAGRLGEIDIPNLADEIDDVARREYDKLEIALARVIQHLLKWDHQPERRNRGWMLTVREHRRRIARQLRKHPALRSVAPEALSEAYEDGRDQALGETRLPESAIAKGCPYAWDEVMARALRWPEG